MMILSEAFVSTSKPPLHTRKLSVTYSYLLVCMTILPEFTLAKKLANQILWVNYEHALVHGCVATSLWFVCYRCQKQRFIVCTVWSTQLNILVIEKCNGQTLQVIWTSTVLQRNNHNHSPKSWFQDAIHVFIEWSSCIVSTPVMIIPV
jgi:hypothetical protein